MPRARATSDFLVVAKSCPLAASWRGPRKSVLAIHVKVADLTLLHGERVAMCRATAMRQPSEAKGRRMRVERGPIGLQPSTPPKWLRASPCMHDPSQPHWCVRLVHCWGFNERCVDQFAFRGNDPPASQRGLLRTSGSGPIWRISVRIRWPSTQIRSAPGLNPDNFGRG